MISRLFDPVFIGLMVLLVGLVGWTIKTPRDILAFWRFMAWSGFVLLWLGASPWFSNAVVRALQPMPIDLNQALSGTSAETRAMVVLAGGIRNHFDYVPPVERLGDETHARLLGGARIYREQGEFGLVIVSGTGIPFVQSMADYLVLHGVPRDRIALESEARDTETNATYSAAILAEKKVKQVVLVTSALHMARSIAAFKRAGVEVIPAPVDYVGGGELRLLPSSTSMSHSSSALHEIVGRFEP